jgi:hypothetical protein
MRLHRNLPDPFHDRTMIPFTLNRKSFVRLSLHTPDGDEIALIAEGRFGAGDHMVTYIAEDLEPGIYYYRLSVEGVSRVRELTFVHDERHVYG